ncbi:hypothetical protein DY245_14895 [Streptomyces inhibens]|uniref:Uncharacterized protein n=1 Tax=Streptomyces inhibens TaxID=2293571 RepID=A0A371Q4H7_STRIH|nr:hypothetical protein [Streptomyces inhibens]REK89620.1 hypothetical protein DY245_14895 [Streptomyces inhibens]
MLLLLVAAALWAWLVYLLAVPYSVDGAHECAALLFRDMIPSVQCLQPRPWWEMLGLLGAALPMSVVGAGLYVAGSVSQSLWYHLQQVQYFETRDARMDSN